MGESTAGDRHGERRLPDSSDHIVQQRGTEHDAAHKTSLFTGVGHICVTAMRLTGVDGAAVAVLTNTTKLRELVYATDALAQELDELQFTVGEGPCLDAYRIQRAELWHDMDSAEAAARWPAFTNDAVSLGARALFAFPVSQPEPLGVLELYRRTIGELTTAERDAAAACAVAIGRTVLANWELQVAEAGSEESAADALGVHPDDPADTFSRTKIHLAAGMAAVQLAVPVDEALDRIRAYSYSHNRSIADVADDIVARRLSMQEERDDAGGHDDWN
ncbi:GAF and ANTAR domain-containing protein [Hoyosella altamirensis]|uniref:ANTAR domain-containing protein n=1 Tax=Hoyosella altamirensis TaxID=616997 RepID=A0A839RRN7_9ACTN|nr:GAF and ANTAR domain-containing protein [Hoyosella altamirensis]MBB3038766.1 hypothetical protein [Hoyosella altamirensis]